MLEEHKAHGEGEKIHRENLKKLCASRRKLRVSLCPGRIQVTGCKRCPAVHATLQRNVAGPREPGSFLLHGKREVLDQRALNDHTDNVNARLQDADVDRSLPRRQRLVWSKAISSPPLRGEIQARTAASDLASTWMESGPPCENCAPFSPSGPG